jgi:hypothetical protein
LRTSATPEPIKDWSMTSLKEKLIKIGAKVVSHSRYVAFQMAEVAIPRNLFVDIRFEMPISTLRSPLENCRGTRPTQAARCRPFLNSDPSPMAATIAVAVFGPTPLILAIR